MGLNKILCVIIHITEIFWSEGYCYFLDFMQITYYQVSNGFSNTEMGQIFPAESRKTIDTLGNNECKILTGLYVGQLQRIFRQFCISQYVRYRDMYCFSWRKSVLALFGFQSSWQYKVKYESELFWW